MFFGVGRFCGYFLGSSENWTIFRGHFYAFKSLFLRVKVLNVGYFWGVAKIANIFWGCSNF